MQCLKVPAGPGLSDAHRIGRDKSQLVRGLQGRGEHQVVHVAADLVAKEAIQRAEVSLDDGRARLPVTGTPRIQQSCFIQVSHRCLPSHVGWKGVHSRRRDRRTNLHARSPPLHHAVTGVH